jgi:hypothetical protein
MLPVDRAVDILLRSNDADQAALAARLRYEARSFSCPEHPDARPWYQPDPEGILFFCPECESLESGVPLEKMWEVFG